MPKNPAPAEPEEAPGFSIDVPSEDILRAENERLWGQVRALTREKATLEAGMNQALGELASMRNQIDELAKEVGNATGRAKPTDSPARRRGAPEGEPTPTGGAKGKRRPASGKR